MHHCISSQGFAGPVAMAAVLALTAGAAVGQDHSQHGKNGMGPFFGLPRTDSTQLSAAAPPLWDDLGSLHYPVITANPLAQQYFDQGLRLAYAFNHAEARR